MSIQEIKTKVPIAKLVEHLGGRLMWDKVLFSHTWIPTVCPFHEDNNPSAGTNPFKGRFNCHGCGVRGDVIDLAKLATGTEDIREAMKWLTDELT